MREWQLLRRIDALVSRHYGCPAGLVGWVAGKRMVRQHAVETEWTIARLALGPADRVLEVGCGAGRALELAAREVPEGEVVGVDLSPVMVQAARRRNARAVRAGRVRVECGDVMRLPFAGQHFHKVWSIHSLYFWPDRAGALGELRRVLRPGGMLVLTLTTGQIDAGAGTGYFETLIDDLLREMRQAGFANSVAEGPDSRGWRIAAAVGIK